MSLETTKQNAGNEELQVTNSQTDAKWDRIAAVSGSEALTNQVLFWLNSSAGDYYDPELTGSQNWGGPLYLFLGKTVTQDKAQELIGRFQTEFQVFFEDNLFLQYLDISVDAQRRCWILDMKVTDENVSAQITVGIQP